MKELGFGKTLGGLDHWGMEGGIPLLRLGAAVEGQCQSQGDMQVWGSPGLGPWPCLTCL